MVVKRGRADVERALFAGVSSREEERAQKAPVSDELRVLRARNHSHSDFHVLLVHHTFWAGTVGRKIFDAASDSDERFCTTQTERFRHFKSPKYRVGRAARREPRFRLFLFEILLSLPHLAGAGGNLAERADHLGSNGGNNQIQINKR